MGFEEAIGEECKIITFSRNRDPSLILVDKIFILLILLHIIIMIMNFWIDIYIFIDIQLMSLRFENISMQFVE